MRYSPVPHGPHATDNMSGLKGNSMARPINNDGPTFRSVIVGGVMVSRRPRASPHGQILCISIVLHPIGEFIPRGMEWPILRITLIKNLKCLSETSNVDTEKIPTLIMRSSSMQDQRLVSMTPAIT